MIDLQPARDLLDFGARIGQGARAEEQLEGAVAVHNLLATRGNNMMRCILLVRFAPVGSKNSAELKTWKNTALRDAR